MKHLFSIPGRLEHTVSIMILLRSSLAGKNGFPSIGSIYALPAGTNSASIEGTHASSVDGTHAALSARTHAASSAGTYAALAVRTLAVSYSWNTCNLSSQNTCCLVSWDTCSLSSQYTCCVVSWNIFCFAWLEYIYIYAVLVARAGAVFAIGTNMPSMQLEDAPTPTVKMYPFFIYSR
jgi:hypothetical protein